MVGVPQRRYLNALDPRQCLLPRVELSHGARPQPRRRGGASRHDGQRGRRRVSADRAQGALYGGDLRGCHRHTPDNETDGHFHSSQHSAPELATVDFPPTPRAHESLKSSQGGHCAGGRTGCGSSTHVGQPGHARTNRDAGPATGEANNQRSAAGIRIGYTSSRRARVAPSLPSQIPQLQRDIPAARRPAAECSASAAALQQSWNRRR